MRYSFKTDKGTAVELETEVNRQICFELRLTCKEVGANKQRVVMFEKENLIKFTTPELSGKVCGVYVPADIAEPIRKEYDAACRDTDKIIIATIKDNEHKVVRELYGKPIIDPGFRLYYYMPAEMELRLRSYAYQDKIYDHGGIEDECAECSGKSLYCKDGATSHYWMRHAESDDPFLSLDELNEENSTMVDYELDIRVVTPISNC